MLTSLSTSHTLQIFIQSCFVLQKNRCMRKELKSSDLCLFNLLTKHWTNHRPNIYSIPSTPLPYFEMRSIHEMGLIIKVKSFSYKRKHIKKGNLNGLVIAQNDLVNKCDKSSKLGSVFVTKFLFSSSFRFHCSSTQPKKDRSRSWSSMWLGDSAPESSDIILPKGLPYNLGSVPGRLS